MNTSIRPQATTPVNQDSPDLWVFPPILPLGGLVLGLILEHFFPLAQRVSGLPEAVRVVLALALLVTGAATFIGSHVALHRAKTAVSPGQPTWALSESWPYSWTRNPMYLGGDLIYLGLAFACREYWWLLLFPIVQALCHYGVVLKEEEYLGKKFGACYLAYQTRVRRWF